MDSWSDIFKRTFAQLVVFGGFLLYTIGVLVLGFLFGIAVSMQPTP